MDQYRTSSGDFATLAAIRRVSSLLSNLAADRQPGSCSAIIYSITSSAVASSEGGMVIPRALAVLRLITNSNLVGC